jgi:hypothetical protein
MTKFLYWVPLTKALSEVDKAKEKLAAAGFG